MNVDVNTANLSPSPAEVVGFEQDPDTAGHDNDDDGLHVMEICRSVQQVDVTEAPGGHRLRD